MPTNGYGKCLVQLNFEVIEPIQALPHFHGVQLKGMLEYILGNITEKRLNTAGISFVSPETGVLNLKKNEKYNCGLVFPVEQKGLLKNVLQNFNLSEVPDNPHFVPSKTILLTGYRDRISGTEDFTELTGEHIQPEIEEVMSLEELSVNFFSPVIINRPSRQRSMGGNQIDGDFFVSNPEAAAEKIAYNIAKITSATGYLPEISVKHADIFWNGTRYGNEENGKSITGFSGNVTFYWKPDIKTAELFVLGQYLGIGKSRAYGCGFYEICGLKSRAVSRLERASGSMADAFSEKNLDYIINSSHSESTGPDGIPHPELKKSSKSVCRSLHEKITEETYQPGAVRKLTIPKKNGSKRTIFVPNAIDAIVEKAAAAWLYKSTEHLLSDSSFAFRKGTGISDALKKYQSCFSAGYTRGIKADIRDFYDCVSVRRALNLLNSMLYNTPEMNVVGKLLERYKTKGLPQGSSLSPHISSLFMAMFDGIMEKLDIRTIRYADDFILLFRESAETDVLLGKVASVLRNLGLELNLEKTETFDEFAEIEFLGYVVSMGESLRKTDETEQIWNQAFSERWFQGHPLYLTVLDGGAFSSGNDIVISRQGEQTRVPWKKISRIVIVGRKKVSGGVYYRAMREGIPVAHMDVLGRLSGEFIPETFSYDVAKTQHEYFDNIQNRLELTIKTITAKISNTRTMLMRNGIKDDEMKEIMHKIKVSPDIEKIRGYEGYAAGIYFGHFAKLVAPFEFTGRTYNPPECPVNALLSFGYTLLYHRMSHALLAGGFDPIRGFFHIGRYNHRALASDMMEELRYISDGITLKMIHKKILAPEDFTESVHKDGKKRIRLTGEGFRKFIVEFETRMNTLFTCGGLGRITYYDLIDEQVKALAKTVKLGIGYTPHRIR